MTIAHIGVWKVAGLALALASVLAVALDPSVQVAMIVGATAVSTAVISGGVALWMHRADRRERQEDQQLRKEDQARLHSKLGEVKDTMQQVETNTNNNLTQANQKLTDVSVQLAEVRERLSHAEGRKEGAASERDKQP
jgi:septal ring factor EnvC (AmiA/AmiB activator)